MAFTNENTSLTGSTLPSAGSYHVEGHITFTPSGSQVPTTGAPVPTTGVPLPITGVPTTVPPTKVPVQTLNLNDVVKINPTSDTVLVSSSLPVTGITLAPGSTANESLTVLNSGTNVITFKDGTSVNGGSYHTYTWNMTTSAWS
jgi:hypothetical protein